MRIKLLFLAQRHSHRGTLGRATHDGMILVRITQRVMEFGRIAFGRITLKVVKLGRMTIGKNLTKQYAI